MQLDLQVARTVSTVPSRPDLRARGAYYTPVDAAHAMAAWALRREDDVVLEPSFGEGAFLGAVSDLAAARGWSDITALRSHFHAKTFVPPPSSHSTFPSQ